MWGRGRWGRRRGGDLQQITAHSNSYPSFSSNIKLEKNQSFSKKIDLFGVDRAEWGYLENPQQAQHSYHQELVAVCSLSYILITPPPPCPILLSSNGKSSIVEERILGFVFVP
jgi:hypothetical protein